MFRRDVIRNGAGLAAVVATAASAQSVLRPHPALATATVDDEPALGAELVMLRLFDGSREPFVAMPDPDGSLWWLERDGHRWQVPGLERWESVIAELDPPTPAEQATYGRLLERAA